MRKLSNCFLVLMLCVALVLPTMASAAKDDFPSKPLEFIVPWSAGGGVDVLMRAIGTVFPKYANGQQLVIKNVPGGGAAIGFTQAMKAKPDGYTLTSGTTPMITKIHMSKVAFSVDSFEPVMMFADIPCYILVHKDSPFKNLKDYVEYAKKNPGKVTLGNGGSGGGTHLVGLGFQQFAGIDLNNIPFEGGGPSITALMGKHVDSVIGSSPEGISQVMSGDFRILGIFADQRLSQFPDVPTAAELGIEYYGTMWRGIIAPKNTPKKYIDKWEKIFKQCMEDPEFVKKADEMVWPLKYMGTKEFGKFMKEEDARYKNLIITSKMGDRYKDQY